MPICAYRRPSGSGMPGPKVSSFLGEEDVGEQGDIESEVGELLAKLLDHWWWGVTS